jgi:drug/metabolite transporter (DMT)-like permease
MKQLAFLKLNFIVLLWGFTAVVGKLITTDAMVLVVYRTLLATLLLYAFYKIVRQHDFRLGRSLWLKSLGLGALLGLHWLCFFESIKQSNIAVCLSCTPIITIFVAFLQPFFFKKKIKIIEIVLALTCLACMYFIFNTDFSYLFGLIYGVFGALLYAIISVINAQLVQKTSSESIIFYEMIGACLISLLYVSVTDISLLASVSGQDFGYIFILAAGLTVYPMVQSVKLMKLISPFALSLSINLEPVYGIVLGYYFFTDSETMTPSFYLASGLMLLCIIFYSIYTSLNHKKP